MSRTRIRPDFGRCKGCRHFISKDYKYECDLKDDSDVFYLCSRGSDTFEGFIDEYEMRASCPEREKILEDYFKDRPNVREIKNCRGCEFFKEDEKYGFYCRSFVSLGCIGSNPMSLDTAFPVKEEFFEKLEIPTCIRNEESNR